MRSVGRKSRRGQDSPCRQNRLRAGFEPFGVWRDPALMLLNEALVQGSAG
jgi:hypothetical protein